MKISVKKTAYGLVFDTLINNTSTHAALYNNMFVQKPAYWQDSLKFEVLKM